MRSFILALALLVCSFTAAYAAEPFFAFEPAGKTGPVPGNSLGWHSSFEDVEDYGETWFFLTQTNEGGLLVAMATISNIGPGTFNGRIDAQFYPPTGGKPVHFYKELKRDDVHGSTSSMEARVGSAHVWGNSSRQHMTIDDPNFTLKLDFENALPSLQFGDGIVHLYKDKSVLWATGLFAPRAKASGTLRANGQTYSMVGAGYGDHSYSTVKIPTMMKKWFSLRAYDKKYTVVFQDQYMSEKFGNKKNTFGVFGVDGQSYPIRNYIFKPTAFRKDPKSNYSVPTAFDVEIKAGPYTVKGTVKEAKQLDAIDVLAQVNAFVRAMIKAFYSNPFIFRTMDQYELDVTGPDGVVEHVSGQGLVEASFF